MIGTGGRALQLMDHLIPKPKDPVQGGIPQWKTKPVEGAEVVAVADVYQPHRNQAAAKAGANTAQFHDYRKLLDQKDVQAVIIAAPDHWHKQMLVDALAAGKDVYLEKPATHTLEEGPQEIQAVEKSGRIVQTGTQQRSWPHYVQGKQILASGALGVVRLVDAFWFMNYGIRGVNNLPRSQEPPANLDWMAWLGSAPAQPFNHLKFRVWRQFWDFGGGNLADLMTHAIETVHWYMECDTPASAVGIGHTYDWPFECPDVLNCTLEYPKGFLLTYAGCHTMGMDFGSIIFRGSKATLEISRACWLFTKKIAAAAGHNLTGPSGAGGRSPKSTSNRSMRELLTTCAIGWNASAPERSPMPPSASAWPPRGRPILVTRPCAVEKKSSGTTSSRRLLSPIRFKRRGRTDKAQCHSFLPKAVHLRQMCSGLQAELVIQREVSTNVRAIVLLDRDRVLSPG